MFAYIAPYSPDDSGVVVIRVQDQNTGIEQVIPVRLTRMGTRGDSSWVPSVRLLKSRGVSQEEWDTNALVYSAWEGVEVPVRELHCVGLMPYFEDALSYATAVKMVEAINASY